MTFYMISICRHIKVGLTPDGTIALSSYIMCHVCKMPYSAINNILDTDEVYIRREKSTGVVLFHLSGQLDGNLRLTGSCLDNA